MRTFFCSALFVFLAAVSRGLPAQVQPAAPTLRVTEATRIDGTKLDLTPVGSINVAPDGTIIVSQPLEAMMRFFSPTGTPLGSYGRRGQGPGEFSSLTRIGFAGDTLWAFDVGQRRLTFLTTQRTVIRSVVFPSAHATPADAARYPRIPGVSLMVVYPGGDALVYPFPPAQAPFPTGWDPEKTPLIRIAGDGTIKRLIAWRAPGGAMLTVPVGTGSASIAIPFASHTAGQESPNGRWLAFISPAAPGEGNIFHAVLLGTDGDTIYTKNIPYTAVPVPTQVADSARAAWQPRPAQAPAAREALTAAIAAYGPLSTTYPPFNASDTGDDGSVWIAMRTPTEERAFLVLDAQGNVYGRAVVPSKLNVMRVSLTGVWGTLLDADDVPSIVQYRIARP